MAKKKKASSRKKTGSKKKSARRASSTKKSTTKKSSSRKKSSGAAASAKKSASKKKSVKKKSAGGSKKKSSTKSKKKTAPSSGASKSSSAKSSKKVGAKSKKTSTRKKRGASASSKKESAERQKEAKQQSLEAAKAAASKLAAAAGLRPVETVRVNGDKTLPSVKRLTKSPLGKRELDKFRKILLEKRAEVAGDVSDLELEALFGGGGALSSLPQHLADQGSDEYEQSLTLDIASTQRVLLREIDAALDRIVDGTYGICESLGIAIEKERLEAQPWTRFSLEGARLMDAGRRGR